MASFFKMMMVSLMVFVESEALVQASQPRKMSTRMLATEGGATASVVLPRAGPAGVYDAAVAMGAVKAGTPTSMLVPLSLLSGAHIALGAFLMVSCGGESFLFVS